MQSAADGPAASAIDLAEMLVEQGMPFRQAHALIGGLVRESLERHVPLVELVAAHPDLGEAAVELLEPGVAVTRRRTPGGAGPGPVGEQAGALRPPARGRPGAAGPVAAPGGHLLGHAGAHGSVSPQVADDVGCVAQPPCQVTLR